MEISTLMPHVFMAALLTIIPVLIAWFSGALHMLLRSFLYFTTVRQQNYVDRIGELIMKQNARSGEIQFFATPPKPAPGWHMVTIDKHCVLAYFYYDTSMANTRYAIYKLVSLHSLHNLSSVLLGKEEILKITFEAVPKD
jgi:hypothetical protein